MKTKGDIRPGFTPGGLFYDMTIEEKNILTLKEYFIVYSKATGKPYIDVRYGCYLFELRPEAQAFCDEIGNVFINQSKQLQQSVYGAEFYSYGIDTIHVKEKQKDVFTDIKITLDDVEKKQYLNRNAVRTIYRLKQTSKKKYLKNLSNCHFLTPVNIVSRVVGQYPQIHYSYATSNGEDRFYLLFTTMQEFDAWRKTQDTFWCPLSVDLNTFARIRKESPVVVNPCTDRLVLNDKLLRIAREE